MTKRDYVALAEALHHSMPIGSSYTLKDAEYQEAAMAQWRNDVRAIAVVLGADNPRFEHSKFLVAAGVET